MANVRSYLLQLRSGVQRHAQLGVALGRRDVEGKVAPLAEEQMVYCPSRQVLLELEA